MCGILLVQGQILETTFKKAFSSLTSRGPDQSAILPLPSGFLGFHRLAIMGPQQSGMQPFEDPDKKWAIACNGEIYNFLTLKKEFPTYPYQSNSDCEVLVPMILTLSIDELAKKCDGEFAAVFYEQKNQKVLAMRDPLGVRPLFYGYRASGEICFASEAKALLDLCPEITPFPPGHYFDGEKFHSYINLTNPKAFITSKDQALKGIKNYLTRAVEKRLSADVPIGFLLSGGLDSSLVCAIAARKLTNPIETFAVGITENPIDTKYARIVADYLGANHHEVLFTKEEALSGLKNLIYRLETYDVTTIRASIGMDIIARYVRERTDIRVLLTGEVSDELFGYKYTDFAPDALAFQKEAKKRIEELYAYDILRADRSISSNSLEARVPFSDQDFVTFVMSIDPTLKINTTGVGKALLREAFDDGSLLPKEILYRDKAAFSDAVGHGMVDWLKELAEQTYSDKEFATKIQNYALHPPQTKEALLYREIFHEFYPGLDHMIPGYWLPNQSWPNCQVTDPSARILPNYGKSGD